MSSAPIRRDFETRVQAAVLRRTATARSGSRRVTTPPAAIPAPTTSAAFTQRYVKLTRSTSQTFGNELPITWTAESDHGSPIDFYGFITLPSSVPWVSITQPYAVHVIVNVSSVPTDLRAELRGNFPAVAGQFDKVASSVWQAQFNAAVVPDVTLLSSLKVVGKGVGADVTCTSAEMWIYPLR